MKRTELKRKTPLRRTAFRKSSKPASTKPKSGRRLRRVSKTNSKKHIDDAYRAQYMNLNRACELLPLFPHCIGKALVPIDENNMLPVSANAPAEHAHHIASVVMRTPRWDTEWNLIAVSGVAHSFCHRWTSDGLVLCLLAKLESQRLNFAALSKHCRVVFPSYLETLTLRFPFAAECREKLLQGVSA